MPPLPMALGLRVGASAAAIRSCSFMGLSESHVSWQPVAERLSSEFTACTIDRRGRGESGDGMPYALQREIEDVTAVAATLGRVVVLAHSIAGPFALEAAMTSDAVRAVILYEAWASPLSERPIEIVEEIERLVSLGRPTESTLRSIRSTGW
jgi:pimeloyl-ACP methyl ester carboxylesterase